MKKKVITVLLAGAMVMSLTAAEEVPIQQVKVTAKVQGTVIN